MITCIDERELTPADRDWLNARHRPSRGVLITHVPPACDRRQLAAEVLFDLRLDTRERPIVASDPIDDWAQAWLATAAPRCDLVLFGAERLTTSAVRWVTELACKPRVNVWAFVSGDRSTALSARRWPWSLVRSHDWHTRPMRTEQRGRRRQPLPGFPHSYARAYEADDETWQHLLRLDATYTEVQTAVIARLLIETRPPRRRNVAAALARLAVLARDEWEFGVLARLLEHDVFLRGAVLRVDVAHAIEIIDDTGEDDAFRLRAGGFAADPAAAAAAVLEGVARRHVCDVAVDGTHAIDADGVRHDVPSWLRWPLRAAVSALAKTNVDDRPGRAGDVLYCEIRQPRRARDRARLELEPLTSNLSQAFAIEPPLEEESRALTDAFGSPQANAIWRVRDNRRAGASTATINDPATRWLIDGGFAHVNEAGGVSLAPWLRAATNLEAERHGPRFDPAYRADVADNASASRTGRYARLQLRVA